MLINSHGYLYVPRLKGESFDSLAALRLHSDEKEMPAQAIIPIFVGILNNKKRTG